MDRSILVELNTRAWAGDDVLGLSAKLDSSLKKNTAFVKKIKSSMNADQVSVVTRDIEQLSLSKYLSEIISAVYDGAVKANKLVDIEACVAILSKFHQRFTVNFTPQLLLHMLIGLSNELNGDDKTTKLARQRNLLSLLVELSLVGIARTIRDVEKSSLPEPILKRFNTKENSSQSILVVMLKVLLSYEINSGEFLVVAAKVFKRYFGLMKEYLPEEAEVLDGIIRGYTKYNLKILQDLNMQLNATIRDFNKSSLKYGRLFDDRTDELEVLRAKHEMFYTKLQTLCETIDQEFPELTVDEVATENFDSHKTIAFVAEDSQEESQGIWSSLQEQKFYTQIPSLDELNQDRYNKTRRKYVKLTDGEKVTQFLADFESIDSEDDMETLILVFNRLNLNNKATHNRLFRYFTESEFSTTYKYATKFLKINQDNLQVLVQDTRDFLDSKLRSQLSSAKLSFKHIYFYVEFIKFKLIPPFQIFHKLKALSSQIQSSNNLDILTVIYDTCGRFLMYDSDYRDQMVQMVTLLKQHRKSSALTVNTKMAISNLLLIIEAPKEKQKPKEVVQKYTVEQAFLIRLLRADLSPSTLKPITELVLKYPVSNPQYNGLMIQLFTEIEFINYDTIHSLIRVLKALRARDKDIVVRVVDQLVENVYRGIELNDYRMNKERLVHMRLLAEMCNLNLITFNLIIKLCFKILCIGHPNNQPLPMNYQAELDMPNNYFKIQMICLLFTHLDLVVRPAKGSKKSTEALSAANEERKRTFQPFVVFFQYYVFCKNPLPLEDQFKVDRFYETYSQVFDFKRFDTITDCLLELKSIMAAKQKKEVDENEEKANGMDLGVTQNEHEDMDVIEDDEEFEESDDSSESGSDDEDDSIIGEDDEDLDISSSDESVISSRSKDEFTETELDEHPQSDPEAKFQETLAEEFKKLTMEAYSETPVTRTLNMNIGNVPKLQNKEKFSLLFKKGKTVGAREIRLNDESIRLKIQKQKEQQEMYNKRIMNLVSKMED
ncbi:hypothetical protein PSN45_002204 [Yamadazyma tenuis]|uniref:uncharacterized protein n=1 Tax=Candida tenuis TaxID=2315449 RepID=UPI0027A1B6C5|nr:hypothetical protein PSN45_002204 [Yamadazyma tenuis]